MVRSFFDVDCASCDSQPHVTTGADGFYSITLDDGIYQAQCDYIPGCGVQSNSSGQGQTVNVPAGWHRELHRLRAQHRTASSTVPTC